MFFFAAPRISFGPQVGRAGSAVGGAGRRVGGVVGGVVGFVWRGGGRASESPATDDHSYDEGDTGTAALNGER